MNKQQARPQAKKAAAAGPEGCLCREVLSQLRVCLGISPDVQEHFNNSRIEFLKGIRAVIDQRIEHLSSTGQQGTKISVE
jgi:hypothetical protein